MNAAHFKFSPRILARLGEELNQSADQSILELVKNSYDADARRCTIEIVGGAEPGGTIRVADDGVGMNQLAIQNAWLVLGHSKKSSEERTKAGRVPAGSKGLGRLSALRMGSSVHLETIQKGTSRRVHALDIDWQEFEGAKTVEDVGLAIVTKKRKGGGHGTLIELRGLKNAIRLEELKRLARAVLLLTDPFADQQGEFSVDLRAPEFKEIEKLVRAKYFDEADFHLRTRLDAKGISSLQLLDWKGQELASASHQEIRKSGLPYQCPPATFDFWAFLLKGNRFIQGRNSAIGAIRQWLSNFGGVHVYHDGVRVAPYGDPGDDWLRLNLARARSPEERPSTNNSIGKIVVKSNKGFRLTQKTDRSGFIADHTFSELQAFADDALEWLARWRLKQAERRRSSERQESTVAAEKEKKTVEEALLTLAPAARATVKAAFEEYEKSRDRETSSLKREVQLYRTLSTAGITAATFAHESQGNPLKVIGLSVNSLKTRVEKYVAAENRKSLTDLIEKISHASGAMRTLGEATLGLVRADKRRVSKVEIHSVIRNLVSLMEPFWRGRDTGVALNLAAENPYLMGSEAAVESILANLINNALDAFRRGSVADRRIHIQTVVESAECHIFFEDSGPGIVDLDMNDIWLPGITSVANGTGLGLTIVRDTVGDLGGSVSAKAHGTLGGASFEVVLPLVS